MEPQTRTIVIAFLLLVLSSASAYVVYKWLHRNRTTLSTGQTLNQGESIFDPTGTYELKMQTDGNLVLYQKGVTLAKWHCCALGWGVAPFRLIAQADGNYVVYDGTGKVGWYSNTFTGAPSTLSLTTSGVPQILDKNGAILWSQQW